MFQSYNTCILAKRDGRSSQVKWKLSMNSWAVMVPTLSKEPLAALHIPPKNEYKEVPIRIIVLIMIISPLEPPPSLGHRCWPFRWECSWNRDQDTPELRWSHTENLVLNQNSLLFHQQCFRLSLLHKECDRSHPSPRGIWRGQFIKGDCQDQNALDKSI